MSAAPPVDMAPRSAASAGSPSRGASPLAQTAIHLWRLSRPETWMVSILPMYVGVLLATRELVPGLDLWVGFWARATRDGATTEEFVVTLLVWLEQHWPLLAAALVMGPLLWAATLLINDVHDLPGDRLNPRKARSPLVQGLVSRGFAHVSAYVAAALALGLAWPVGPSFLLLTAGCLVLAWVYSVPPLRLKTRPGMDVLVNAVGVGVLSFLAGWAVYAPLAGAPWVFLPQGLLVGAAVYVPTTLIDHDADRAAGYLTLATHLGPERAYRIGWWAWIAANAGAVGLSWAGWIIPRAMLPILIIFTPVLLWEYHVFIGRARTPGDVMRGIILCSLTFLAVNLVFALLYTGTWIP